MQFNTFTAPDPAERSAFTPLLSQPAADLVRSASLCQKMPTSEARTMPMRPMKRNWPAPARLRRVTLP
jgi:hypothetical protein